MPGMPPKSKDRHRGEQIGLRLPTDEAEALRKMSDDTLLDLTTIIRMGLTRVLVDAGYLGADKLLQPRPVGSKARAEPAPKAPSKKRKAPPAQ